MIIEPNSKGYLSETYAESLSDFGIPRKLNKCKGWILKRVIKGFPYHDAMGCYPVFLCGDWNSLPDDLKLLEDDLVSLTLITDPFHKIEKYELSDVFDTAYHYKDHLVADLSQPLNQFIQKRASRYSRQALKCMTVEICDQPERYSEEWFQFYSFLVDKHNISDMRKFSKKSFHQLLKTPGITAFIARENQEILGMEIWLETGTVGYDHLLAMSPRGYEMRAGYALKWTAFRHFSEYLEWLDLGSAPGLDQMENGILFFKKHWSTGTLPVYLCGKIFDKNKYNEICVKRGVRETKYFPAYRAGEFS